MSKRNAYFSHPEYHNESNFLITPHQGVEAQIRSAKVIKALSRENSSATRRQLKQGERIYAAIEKYVKKRNELFGERNVRRFRKFSELQRATHYGVLDFRPGRYDERVLLKAKREARETSLKMMRRAKIDRDKLEKLQDDAEKEIKRALRPTASRAKKLEIKRLDKVPDRILDGTFPGWFVKKPPYDDSFQHYSSNQFGGSLSQHHNVLVEENPFTYITGEFGSFSRYINKDASDFDALFLTYRTGIGLKYHAQNPGKRTIWVKIKSRRSQADVWLDNEFGWSSSWSDYFTHFEISVKELQGIQGKTTGWHRFLDGEPDDKWFHLPLAGNDTDIWIPFEIDFPPGDVLIWVIADDHRQCGLNDVSTDATFETKYKLEEVHISN